MNIAMIPYRLPFARHFRKYDEGFYMDFDKQLTIMEKWLKSNCRRAIDIGAITGGCIEHITRLGVGMDGIHYTEDLKQIAKERLSKADIDAKLHVFPVEEIPHLDEKYDGAVHLGWFNLPFNEDYFIGYLKALNEILNGRGVFLFDFFTFEDVVVSELEMQAFSKDIQYATYSELLENVLRRYHFWILNHERILTEVSDLVDIDLDKINSLLDKTGFRLEEKIFMKLHYPRWFCLARKI